MMELKRFFQIKNFLKITSVILFFSCASAKSRNPSEAVEVGPFIPIPELSSRLEKSNTKDASIQTLYIKLSEPIIDQPTTNLRVYYNQKEVEPFIWNDSNPKEYRAFLPVPYLYEKKYGVIEIRLTGNYKQQSTQSLKFSVSHQNYKSEKLRVNPAKVIPPEDAIDRIKREKDSITAIYKRVTPKRFWVGQFSNPIDSIVTSQFGNKRLFNGELKSYHSGLDLRAAVGKSVNASERGVVVLAKDLYYTGNSVIIDHGFGIFTLYAHLSEIEVKEDQYVEPGQVIGKAGATGRVSGPHLHWGATVLGVKVNPGELAKISH